MNDAQIWTIIGILAAALTGMLTINAQSFQRALTGHFQGLRGELIARFEKVDLQFEQVDGRLDRMDGRLDRVEGRIDALDQRVARVERRVDDIDRDVQVIVKRIFPEE